MRDAGLAPIAAKVERRERLTRDDALALFASPDLLTIGRLADSANRTRHGNRVSFAANQHINPTNVCVLRNTCVFCSFARMPQEDGSYTRTLEEVFAEADAARENPTREFHIVGGLHPKLRLQYYLDMFSGLRARHPGVHLKALTAVGVLIRIFVGHTTKDDEFIAKGADLMAKKLPKWDVDGGSIDFYYWHYGTLAMFQVGGDHWKKWNEAMKTALVDTQRTGTDGPSGSWDPIDAWGAPGGRVYATAINVLSLEIYYRYGKVFK